MNLLSNGSFEDWLELEPVLVFMGDDECEERIISNVFTPADWQVWFRHEPGMFDQPEVKSAELVVDPRRVLEGARAAHIFSFCRRHSAGLMQTVKVEQGTHLTAYAFAHAWSNHRLDGYEESWDDPRWSSGFEKDERVWALAYSYPLTDDPWEDARANVLFGVGIDPAGGLNPHRPTVKWGAGAYIYNHYGRVPAVEEVVALGDEVTVFLSCHTLWAFRHNDCYIDSAVLQFPEPESPDHLALALDELDACQEHLGACREYLVLAGAER